MNTLERLERGLERVKKGWTRNALARNSQLKPVQPFYGEAVCWCALGALIFTREDRSTLDGVEEVEKAMGELLHGFPDTYVLSAYNDNEDSQTVIVKLYEKTIARLKKEQSSDQA